MRVLQKTAQLASPVNGAPKQVCVALCAGIELSLLFSANFQFLYKVNVSFLIKAISSRYWGGHT